MRKLWESNVISLPPEAEIEAARSLLGEQLLHHLADLSPTLQADIIAALSVEGKLFHQPALPLDGRWALLPFFLARALNVQANPVYISGAALAMECLICATDLLDDVMDEDATILSEQLGTARALNVALALTSLPPRLLLSPLKGDASATLPSRLLDAIQQALLLASAGQQQDLLAERRMACEMSREDCIEIAASKAGSLLSLACRLGALCVGANEILVEQCAELGRLLGIAGQLDNDAHDLFHALQPGNEKAQKSDLRRGKKTLPVVLAARSLRETHHLEATKIDRTLREIASLRTEEQEIAVSALRAGILATWGISLLYQERARDYLSEILSAHTGSQILLQILGLAHARTEMKDR